MLTAFETSVSKHNVDAPVGNVGAIEPIKSVDAKVAVYRGLQLRHSDQFRGRWRLASGKAMGAAGSRWGLGDPRWSH